MSYQENYEKLGCALSHMSDRLRELLSEVEEGSLVTESWDSPDNNSWQDDAPIDTAAKLKDFIQSLRQDKRDGSLNVDDEVMTLFRDLTDLLSTEARFDNSLAITKKSTTLLNHDDKRDPNKMVLSARACVVCHRDDRPGEQRKSGFKCLECIGTPSKLERSEVSFGVLEKTGTKSSDNYGTKSIDEYDLGVNVGKGSYGKVKICQHKKSGQLYAMKIVDKGKLQKMKKPGSQTTEFEKVLMEIEIMKALQHPNVVKMYEVIDDPDSGKVYLIMEFCAHGRICDIETPGQEGLAKTHPERLKKYIVAIANGLDYLHNQHIYHRDLKPDNILLDSNDHVKLTDFGVSAVTGENDVLTQTEGTPAFNAPEEFEEDKLGVAGDKADIWSFGVTVYCMAFGYLPWMANNLQNLGEMIKTKPEIYPEGSDPQLVDLLRKFLQKDPLKRVTLKKVLDHPYLEDVRTVKGQAVETITCRIKAVDIEKLAYHFDPTDPEYHDCDGVFLKMNERGEASKGVNALCNYINTKGGIYQVVLPTPDSCTLFRPRSTRKARQDKQSRDMSFSFLVNEAGHSQQSFREPPLLGHSNMYASTTSIHSSGDLRVDSSIRGDRDRDRAADDRSVDERSATPPLITNHAIDEAEKLLDGLNLTFL